MACMVAGVIAVPDLLTALHERGVRSVMVEGGARVIRAFLSAAHGGDAPACARGGSDSPGEKRPRTMVDALVVTVAPTIVGEAGVGYGSGLIADAVSEICCCWGTGCWLTQSMLMSIGLLAF